MYDSWQLLRDSNGDTYNAWNMEFRLHPVFTDKKSTIERWKQVGVTTKYYRKLLIFAICAKLQLQFPLHSFIYFLSILLKTIGHSLVCRVYTRASCKYHPIFHIPLLSLFSSRYCTRLPVYDIIHPEKIIQVFIIDNFHAILTIYFLLI